MTWSFLHRTEVIFGEGAFSSLGGRCAALGDHTLLVTGEVSLTASGRLERLQEQLRQAGLAVTHLGVGCEPDDEMVDALLGRIVQADVDHVLAVGGGSVIDAAKALAALRTNPGLCCDFLENLPEGGGKEPANPSLPLIAVPTTAGTGSEVTRNAVIHVDRWSFKRSMRSTTMLPTLAVIDPELMLGAPQSILAAVAFDALGHLVEAYVSTASSPTTDALALPAIKWAIDFLRHLQGGPPTTVRMGSMALAATHGGICLANARLGVAHGLVAPAGGQLRLSHAEGIACLLPRAMLVNHRALTQRADGHPAIAKYERIATLINRDPDVDLAARTLDGWRQDFGIRDLTQRELDADKAIAIIATPSGSITTNPIELTDEELVQVLMLRM